MKSYSNYLLLCFVTIFLLCSCGKKNPISSDLTNAYEIQIQFSSATMVTRLTVDSLTFDAEKTDFVEHGTIFNGNFEHESLNYYPLNRLALSFEQGRMLTVPWQTLVSLTFISIDSVSSGDFEIGGVKAFGDHNSNIPSRTKGEGNIYNLRIVVIKF